MVCHLIVTVVMLNGTNSCIIRKFSLFIGGPTYLQSFKLLCPTVYEEMHLQVNTLFDFDFRVKVTKNINQYTLHHVIYASARFEVATTNGLGEYTITKNMTDRGTDGLRSDFCTKLIHPIFLTTKRV